MNRNLNIVLVIIILGALFAIGVNRWLKGYDSSKHAVSYSHSTYKESRPASVPENRSPFIGNQRSVLRRLPDKGIGKTTTYRRHHTITPRTQGYSGGFGSISSLPVISSGSSRLHTSSSGTLHSVGGNYNVSGNGGLMRNGGTLRNNTNSGLSTFNFQLPTSYSYISRSYLNNQGGATTETTRSAIRRNPTYGNNAPMLYDMRSPITYFNNSSNLNYLNDVNNLNTYNNQGSEQHRVVGMYSAWVAAYQDYYGTGETPTTEQLNAFITWWQGEGFTSPSPDTGGGGGSSGPGTMYQNWLDRFYDYYGRYPSSSEELEDFIQWWQGGGITTPSDPDPTPPGGGPGSIYQAWIDLFYDYYGRNPYDMEELLEFIQWWQGGGIYTPFDAPIGNIPWLLFVLLFVAYSARRRLKHSQ